QSNAPRYHAREVAVERARAAGAVCVLGSATPMLESLERARSGAWEHLRLDERVGGGALPPVQVVDMRLERPDRASEGLFCAALPEFLGQALARGEPAILFLNRRGFAPVLWCQGCRSNVRCASCDMSLAWHRRIRRLLCHGCCEERTLPAACPT